MTKSDRYGAYKESGIEWVGAIPVGWETRPLFAVARENTTSNRAGGESNLLSLSYGRIVRKDIAANDGLLPASFDTYQVIRQNDVVLRLTDLQNDKRSLRSAISLERGIITSAYLALTPTRILPNFLSYLLRAYDLQKVFYSMGGGLRQSMKFSDMKWLPVVLPPESTQQAITEYLDREIAQIDDLIGKQERLIRLLSEKRQAIITHAVTRGLDHDVATSYSGVPWLGEIPAHWTAPRLAWESNQIVDGTHFTPTYVDEGIPFLRVTDIHTPNIDLETVARISRDEHEDLVRRCRPLKGDLLLSKNGTIGVPRVVTWDWEFSIFVSLCLIKLRSDLLPGFAEYVFLSSAIKSQIDDNTKQSTVTNLHLEKIRQFRIPLPPLSEQQEIVDCLSLRTKKIDAVIGKARMMVKGLVERRSALISAAVAGKINVTKEGVGA